MVKTRGGSWQLQGLGALLILATFGAFARAKQVDLFFAEMGLLLIAVGFILLYLGSKRGPVERPLPVGEAALPAPRLVGDPGGIDAVLAISAGAYKRQCWGELYLGSEGLWYICYADRMAIGSAASVIARRQQVRAELKGIRLEQAVTQNQYSRSFAVAEVAGFKKTFWMGQSFTAAGVRYQFALGLGRTQRDQVRVWCSTHGIPCEGF